MVGRLVDWFVVAETGCHATGSFGGWHGDRLR